MSPPPSGGAGVEGSQMKVSVRRGVVVNGLSRFF